MKVALITPIPNLKDFEPLMEVDFILPQLVLMSPAYKRFYKKSKRFKIIDNGAWEIKRPISFSKVLEISKELKIDEIILPDLPYKKEESYRLTKFALESLSRTESRSFRFMALPQGNSPADLLDSYEKYLELGVETIGFTRFPCVTGPFDRVNVVRTLQLTKRWSTDVEYHFLGLDNPTELLYVNGIRSVDTKFPYKYAVKHDKYDPYTVQRHSTFHMTTEVKRFDLFKKLKWNEIIKAKANIKIMKKYANKVVT